MIWQDSLFLWFLVLIPILIVGFGWKTNMLQKTRAKFFSDEIFGSLRRGFWKIGDTVKITFSVLGITFVIVALAGPKVGTEVREVKRQGIDMLVALDLSMSMQAEDVKPNRLEKAKFEINRLIERLRGDRVGLVVFTGEAFVQSPMTLDYSALRLFLEIADTDQMPSSSTNFRAAMETALNAFETLDETGKASDAAKVLLIISDGEDHGQSFDAALKKLTDKNISVYTLGIGTVQGTTIPIYDRKTGSLIAYKRDNTGEVVTTALESNVLKNIATRANGAYYSIERGNDGIDAFLARVDKLEKGEFSNQEYADFKNQYQWVGGLALFCFAFAYLIPAYRKDRHD